jgi:hypothetical protein
LQRTLSPAGVQFHEPLDVESRASTVPLGQAATIACGTAGYAARSIAARLVDHSPALPCSESCFRGFITSRNIHRYAIDARTLRYMDRDYVCPRLPRNCCELTPAKRALFASAKIVVAGMSRRLEAAMDSGGLALGVQVFAVSRSQVDLYYLLGLLNSKLLSYLFATRFSGKRLGGGYLAINKGQLARLPVRMVGVTEREDLARQRRISELARLAGPGCVAVDAEIDRLVFELYRMRAEEVRRVEGYFGSMRAAA